MLCVQNTDNSHRDILMLCLQNIDNSVMLSVQNTDKQTTDNSHRHAVCPEHRQFSLSCCVCRSQTIVIVMLCVQNTNRTQTSLTVMLNVKNTDNSHRHVVCAEHRQFSPSCCVQNTDKQSTDNSHRHVVCRTQTKRTQTILTVMLCAEHRQTEHRQFSPSCCVQNTDKENTDNSHCHFVRVEHSWAVVWTRPSAVPTTPCGNCSSRTERGTSTVCDTAAYWSVGTDPSRLLWHQDGQTLTQWGTAHHTPTADRSKRAKLLLSPSSLSCSLCPAFFLSIFFVLPVLSSSFLSSLFSLSFLLPFCLLCSVCLSFFFVRSVLPSYFVFFVLSVFLSSFLSFLVCLFFFLSLFFVLSCVLPSSFLSLCSQSFFLPFCLRCSLYLVSFVLVFFVLSILPSSFLSFLFSLSFLLLFCLLCSVCLVSFLPVFFVLSVLPFFFQVFFVLPVLSSFLSSFFYAPPCSVLKRNKLIGILILGLLWRALYT